MHDNKRNSKPPAESQDIMIARLAFIGASITTLGDGIATIAAALALEALEKSSTEDNQNANKPSQQAESMQKQIDYIISELKQIKKMMR